MHVIWGMEYTYVNTSSKGSSDDWKSVSLHHSLGHMHECCMNAPPPYWNARDGKRHMLPRPTAEPTAAKMNAGREDQRSRSAPIDAIGD